jgi:hypothetical protein
MKLTGLIILLLVFHHSPGFSQSSRINSQLFFLDDRLIDVTLTTDIRKLRNDKKTLAYVPANITMKFSDTSVISEDIRVKPRGVYRKANCDLASLLLNFKNSTSPELSDLKKLKLVSICQKGATFDELLLKEYLVYKIQNLLSNKSFRVRLLHITFKDIRQRMKPFTQYAFLMEDMVDMAARNNCVELKKTDLVTVGCNREQMTFVNLFQYMIGNTDWSIPKCHNMKLMVPKNDTLAQPFAIPYDFDYCGLVNASYAVPDESFELQSVRDRLYRGFPRIYSELQGTIDIFNEKKESILYYINHFDLCSTRCRNAMTAYLDEFFETISSRKKIESIFILNARTQ